MSLRKICFLLFFRAGRHGKNLVPFSCESEEGTEEKRAVVLWVLSSAQIFFWSLSSFEVISQSFFFLEKVFEVFLIIS